MDSKNTALCIRSMIFSVLAAVLVYVPLVLYWPTVYVTVPLLSPLIPYLAGRGEVVVTILYFILLGGITGFLTRGQLWIRSAAVFVGVCLTGAVIVHSAMALLGYKFFMEAL